MLQELQHSAKRLAENKFYGMYDKSGSPYIDHSLSVGNAAYQFGRTEDEKYLLRIVGYLHDIIEDSDVSCSDLKELGFPDEVVSAVFCLSNKHNNGEKWFDYDTFIANCGKDYITAVVKMCNIMHNLSRPRHSSFKLNEKLSALTYITQRVQSFL